MSPLFDLADTPLARGVTLIEASAGTGKTYTLAGLFLRLVVEEGLQANQILVTTYTVPATAELRDRIRKRLREALEAWTLNASDDPLLQALLARARVAPDLARRRLEAALHAFDEVAIHTIHGFCQRILQDRAFESRMLFDAELITDQSALLREVAEDYWRAHFHTASPSFAASALVLDLRPATLGKLLKDTNSHARLRILPETIALDGLQQQIEDALAELRVRWPEWRESVRALFLDANDWAKAGAKPAVMEPLLALVEECAAHPEASLECYAALDSFTPENIAKETKAKREPPAHEFFGLCARITAVRTHLGVAVEVDFLAWARAELPRRKTQRNVLGFDDLLIRLHTALTGTGGEALAQAVRARFPAALIDEFQDTDPIQEEIFRTIFATPQHRLYLIGDPKQAIYGFRGADIFSYLAGARRADHTFHLGTNFRSTKALVVGVNAVFQRSPNPFLVEQIGFSPVAASGKADQTPLRVEGKARAPFHIWLPESSDPLVATQASEELPRRVAAEIARLLDGRAQLGEKPLAPPNVAVLTAWNRQARAMQSALSAFGIPSVLLSNASVFESREAAELHTLLAAVAEPLREGLLRTALATRLLGFGAAEIDALSSDEGAWEKWLLRFQGWHAAWRERGFVSMFHTLERETEMRPRLLGQPDGERTLTNVLHLVEILHQTAIEQRLAPGALVHWLADRRREKAVAAEEHELRLERDEDAVKVVTVHKSKGLEYDVVFCPFAWGKAELRDGERPLFHTGDPQELALDLGSNELATHEALAAQEKLAEQTRLLYVALTRAKHECHFVWGRFAKNEVSAALWLLHPPPPGADPIAALQARGAALDPASLRAEIEALAATAPEAIAAVPWPAPEAALYRPSAEPPVELRARAFRGTIEHDWRVSSFSSLTEHRETEPADHDRAAPAAVAVEAAVVPGDIHAFRAGKTAGVCLHAIFETLDFTRPQDVPRLVEEKLGAFGFAASEWREPVAECVRRVLEVELAPGLQLARVPPTARLNELEFHFPVARLDAAALARVLTGERFVFDSRRGLLRGFIDLVFEHAGRFYIVDWKSNRLGANTAAYHQEALHEAMTQHHYGLQYHLYTLALHRYLAWRLGAEYDYERHFGGVFYIFLRGVDPARPELGVFRDRPSAARLAALDALFSPPP